VSERVPKELVEILRAVIILAVAVATAFALRARARTRVDDPPATGPAAAPSEPEASGR